MKKKRIAAAPTVARRARHRRGRPPAWSEGGTSATPEPVGRTIRRLKRELAKALQRIEELTASAERDFLLGIVNRRGFSRELDRSIAYIKRYHATGALILLDVDRLKPINDAFGHAAGDQVLKAVAASLVSQVRSSDVVGRLGGDEFGVLLWNLDEVDAHGKAIALERAIDALSFSFGDTTVHAGASAGIAILDIWMDAQSAFEAADRAMYVRKAQRRLQSEISASERAAQSSPRSSRT
ncbi:GGDEF domain-containing protein [Bradyrhizobium sp. STM 3557]|uniref:GGDEF domain-containing protein n=1 Tax=Bradyrhizobium sp. STM 3557 TaxID=578920 RepID=UPI003890ED4F